MKMENKQTLTSFWVYSALLTISSIFLLFWIDEKKYEIEILWVGALFIVGIAIFLYIRARHDKKLNLNSSVLVATLLAIYASSWTFFYATFEMYPKIVEVVASTLAIQRNISQAFSFAIANSITLILAIIDLVSTEKENKEKLNSYLPIVILNIAFILSYLFFFVKKIILLIDKN